MGREKRLSFYLSDFRKLPPVLRLLVCLDTALRHEEGAMEAGGVSKYVGYGGWGGGKYGDLAQGIAAEETVVADALDASR